MNNKKVLISLGAVVAVAAGTFGIAAMNKKPATPSDTTETQTAADQTVATPVAEKPTGTKTAVAAYKDGTYTAVGSYRSPGGPDQISITATLKNDVITDISATPMPGDKTSEHYQSLFISGYKPLVVGKNIDSVKLNAVSGSSLTPIGFNEAITKIKAEASA